MAVYTADSNGGDKEANSFGIPFGHAYTVLGVCTITGTNGAVLDSAFKMRNPWGSDSFNTDSSNTYHGKWNDADPLWKTVSTSVKASCGYVDDLNDGIFFTSKSEFA